MTEGRNNSLDQYSVPARKEETELATVYWLNPRDSKKGRLFMPVYDERFPLAFQTTYVYLSKFLEKDNASGNHYHKVKEEILIPLQGEFEIHLVDTETKRGETIQINSDENKAVYVKTGIAHRIISREDAGVLLVLASKHSTLEDEIEYTME